MKLHLTSTLLTSCDAPSHSPTHPLTHLSTYPPVHSVGFEFWGSGICQSWKLLKCASIKATSHTHHPFTRLALYWKMCYILGWNFNSYCISLLFSGSWYFLRFFLPFFYNKLDLRKNCSPFISGGLMVSKRAACTIKPQQPKGECPKPDEVRRWGGGA